MIGIMAPRFGGETDNPTGVKNGMDFDPFASRGEAAGVVLHGTFAVPRKT